MLTSLPPNDEQRAQLLTLLQESKLCQGHLFDDRRRAEALMHLGEHATMRVDDVRRSAITLSKLDWMRWEIAHGTRGIDD